MQKLTVEKLLYAIEKKKGNIAAVARGFGVTRKAVYKRIKASTQLQEALDEAREVMLDDAESTLYTKALLGSTPELIFFLKTQGRRRGYIERYEHSGADGEPIEHRIVIEYADANNETDAP